MNKLASPSRRRFIQAGAGFAVAIPLRRVDAQATRAAQSTRLGPGALEADVQYHIDRQLAGAHGAGERLYKAGPWRDGTPSQGYKLPRS